ncbi:replication protein P [Psychromonas sp. psych-6C06]|uniref:replication protein P n=1 Tax=Psychromonas sp. psych-6C06 TaxID=2058089 RepID=UPI000C32F044|nr:replication protein P [Psychromonas sp. psych-6C06]PKF60635.1 replication protein P [Psychromonas sp. psych-6C06]
MQNLSTMVKHTTPMQVVDAVHASSPRSALPSKLSHETTMLVNTLFAELQAIFPAWRNTFPSEESLNHAKKSWVKGFLDAGIKSISQLKLGVKHARACKSPHWPSVGTFVDWCKPTPEDYGLPCREDAYREAIANLGSYITANWSHAAVREAVRNTTCHLLKTANERVSRAEFYRNYTVLVNRVMRGENVNVDVPKAISAVPESRPVPQAVAIENAKNLKKLVGLL